VVDWGSGMFAGCCRGSNCSLVRSMDGCISTAAPLALADQLPLPIVSAYCNYPVALTVWTTGQVLMLCTAFLCLSDRLMLLLYTVTLSLCLLLKLNDDDDDYDDCKARLIRFCPCKTCCIRITGFSCIFCQSLFVCMSVIVSVIIGQCYVQCSRCLSK